MMYVDKNLDIMTCSIDKDFKEGRTKHLTGCPSYPEHDESKRYKYAKLAFIPDIS